MTRNTHRQPSAPTIRPPAAGPSTGTTTAGNVTVAIRRPRLRPPAAPTSNVVTIGCISPPPTPCSTRNAIRLPMSHASPAATDPATNSNSDPIQTFRAPHRCAAHPLSGTAMDRASR